jgi:hypothetical protein
MIDESSDPGIINAHTQEINMTLQQLAQRIKQGFESDSGLTPEFKAFSTAFKKTMKTSLKDAGAELVSFSRGHFTVSGFYRSNGQLGYFSVPDVRGGFHSEDIMFRTASHEKDYTGGSNRWTMMDSDTGTVLASIGRD